MSFNKISFSTDYKKSAYDVLGTCIPNDSRHTVLHFLWKYRHICTGDSDWDPVPVAVINKLETKSSGTFFADFLDAMNGRVLDIQDVKNEKDAKKKLENDEILGIYYIKEIPSLTITKNGVSQSILTSLLNTYNQNAHLFKVIARTHPERLSDAVASLQTNGSFITEKSVGGKTLNPTVLYFFA